MDQGAEHSTMAKAPVVEAAQAVVIWVILDSEIQINQQSFLKI